MKLNTGRAKIKQSFDNLAIRWEETRAGWADAARRDFEEEHLEPLSPDVQAALRAIDRLSAVISQMESDCS
jgi:hypothetical protein